tara:strand:+ start:1491 stop:2216 length:726 start_codon:yes stop_codon:yes gene_type:complete
VEDYIINPFSQEWIVTNSITLLSIFFIIYIGKNIMTSKINKIKLGYVIGVILVLRFFASHLYQIYGDPFRWNLMESLPLQLCGMSAIISSILLFRFNQFFYEFLVLLGLPGAIISLLTPEMTMGYSPFLLVEYFVSHGGIVLSAFYLTIVLGHKPSLGSWKKIAVASQVVLLFSHLANLWLNKTYPDAPVLANYMYTVIPPHVDLPLLIWDSYYYVGFEIFGFMFIMISYFSFTRKKAELK